MKKKRTTDEVRDSWPEWKRDKFDECWSFKWRPGSSKLKAAEAWEAWIVDEKQAVTVTYAARKYTTRSAGPFIKGMAPWMNDNGWEYDLPDEKTEKVEAAQAACECGGVVAIRPYGLCEKCYVDKHSKQSWNGEMYPYKAVLANKLKEMGLVPVDGETKGEYAERCKERISRSSLYKQAGKVGMDQSARV